MLSPIRVALRAVFFTPIIVGLYVFTNGPRAMARAMVVAPDPQFVAILLRELPHLPLVVFVTILVALFGPWLPDLE